MKEMVHSSDQVTIGEAERVSPIDDDLVTFRFVDKALLKHELWLFTRKWFDYREITPLAATRLYMEALNQAYRRHYKENFDRTAGNYVITASIDKIFREMTAEIEGTGVMSRKSKLNLVGCWRGRQCADGLGMPYEVYTEMALRARLSYWSQAHMPRPVHLFSEMVVEKTLAKWEELQAGKLFLSELPSYMIQNYVGAAHQNDYHLWLMDQADKRANKPYYLARFVREDALPMAKVQERYDTDMCERVESFLQ